MKQAFVILLIAMVLATGCATAPNEAGTAQKNTDQIIEIATTGMEPATSGQPEPAAAATAAAEAVPVVTSPLYEKLGAPTRYEVALTPSTDKLVITVDANVILPNVEAIPTVRIQARDFTQEEVTKFFNAFCGDTVMYKARTEETRAEIQERINAFREELKTAEGQRLEKVKQNIAYYEEEYEKAPETIVDEVTDGTLYEEQLGIQEFLAKYMRVNAQEFPAAKDEGQTFGARNNYYDKNTKSGYDFNIGAGIGYSRHSIWGSLLRVNPIEFLFDESVVPKTAVGDLSMTPREAKALVESFWKEHGFTDMVASGVYLASNQNTETMSIDSLDLLGESHVYIVTCGKSVNGVVPVSNDAIWDSQPWMYECCCFTINDEGIQQFRWQSPNTYLETVTSDTAMLPFAQIDEIFRKMMLVKYESEASGNATCLLFSYHVDRVALEWQRLVEQGSSDTGLMIPVWNFYGTYDYQYTNGDHFGSDTITQGFSLPLLSINAIDGSIIDPREGY